MLEQKLRPHYQKFFVDPLARHCSRLSPDHISLLAGALGLLIPLLLVAQHTFLAVGVLLICGYLDSLDGTLARLFSKSSPAGAVIDIVMDRSVEACVVIGLYLYEPQTRALVCLFMLASILICVTSFLVVGVFSENQSEKSFHYSPGLIERPEAFLLFAAMMLLPTWFLSLAVVFSVLVLLTALIRVLEFVKNDR